MSKKARKAKPGKAATKSRESRVEMIHAEPDFRSALKASEIISEHGARKDIMKKLTPLLSRAFNAYGWGILLSADPLPQYELFLQKKLNDKEMFSISNGAMLSYSDFAEMSGQGDATVQGVNFERLPHDGADIILTCDMFVPSGFLGICFLIGDGRRVPSLQEIRLFSLLANQLGAAIENSRLHLKMYSEVRMDAKHADDLQTGLPGKNYFIEELGQELKRSARYGNELTCLFVDFTSLSKVKRKFNEEVYVRLLGKLGALVRSSIREVDLAARYSQSQIVLMLPDTSTAGARVVASRFLESLEQVQVSPGRGKESVSLDDGSLRVCLAQSKGKSDSAKEVVARAQAAFKKAKAAKKRARVIVAPKTASKARKSN